MPRLALLEGPAVSLLEMPSETLTKVLLEGAILAGMAMCFFGIRLFRIALGFAGFLAGGLIAAYLAWRWTAAPEVVRGAVTFADILTRMSQADNQTVLLVWAAAGGIAGAIVSVMMHWVGVFVLGAWLGTMLAQTAMAGTPAQSYYIVYAILALIGGILALVLRRVIVIVSTAFNGAVGAMFGIYALLKHLSPQKAVEQLQAGGGDAWVVLGCVVVLAAIGGYVQFATMPKAKAKEALSGKGKSDKKGS